MFKKAQRTQTKLKIAITGPSGSGKTFSALLIAAGIGKRIAVIDTENKSASLYAGMEKGPLAGLEFDILEIEPPYTIAKYLEGIEAAEKARYDVLLIDSISHAWAGEGGLLDKKTALDARGGNSYTNWAMITPEQERFKARILQADTHIICTMRSKQDYVLELNARGKSVPKKVGLAPIQRDGMEYEFTTVLDMAMDHHAVASKDRTCLFDGQVFKPTKDTGVKIMKWLKAARPIQKPVDPGQDTEQDSTPAASAGQDDHNDTAITEEQLNKISGSIKRIEARGYSMLTINKGITDTVKKVCNRDFMTRGFLNVAAVLTELTEVEADVVISYLSAWETHLNNNKKRPVAKEA